MEARRIGTLYAAAENLIVRMTRTRTNYWGEFALDVPICAALLATGLRHRGVMPLLAGCSVLLGLTVFSFVEYAIHRWLFHGRVRIFVRGHRAHHEDPLGYDALPFFLPALALLAWLGLLSLPLPTGYSRLIAGATALGYIAYGLGHFTIHHARFRNSWARRWAGHHHIHHYHAEVNFGITTPLWDLLLGTRYR